ncbi:m7GpppX diphosphatase [Harpegnathos saltator]|uniref:m7GpppX diphosphatase n=1 Tax=Harpegnathos saltator TaxID=610380 RepID=E2BX33_HARSA|nr:m7GpppX diphosphatase [Harpegnathos saltator]EFN79752.1 Scavenger mRNA-decapping enzyme DcpS [Harpegnathos saltator]
MAEKCAVNIDDGDCPATKRIKLEDKKNADENEDSVCERTDLSDFNVTRVLQNNCARKLICVEGTFKDRADPAIVLLEQKSFPSDKVSLKKGFFSEKTIYQKNCANDIYGNYDCFPAEEYNSLHATVIYPATRNQIEKYLKQESLHMIDETYELYQQVTLPHIESMSLSLEWITNILEHKAEEENIIYEDTDKETGFILVTDLKWDKRLDTLKLLALPLKKIRCLRELDASHLPLLKNIQKAGTEAINKKFNVSASQLRIYFHYQPSYYYLHVHFSYLMFEAPGIYVEKAHLLSTVIRNLELLPDYYSKAILSYVVRKGSPLYERFKSHGVLPADTKV